MDGKINEILARLQLNPNSKLNEVDTQIREENLSRLRQEPSSFNLVEDHDHVLGEGSFGRVYRGVYESRTVVAIKVIRPPTQGFNVHSQKHVSKFIKRIEDEVLLMSFLSHPAIVHC